MSSIQFLGIPAGAGHEAQVLVIDEDGFRCRLPHHVMHSPAGFAWGYDGSGPTDLAWALFAYVTGENPDDIDPDAVYALRAEFVEPLVWGQRFTLNQSDIEEWLDAKQSEYEAVADNTSVSVHGRFDARTLAPLYTVVVTHPSLAIVSTHEDMSRRAAAGLLASLGRDPEPLLQAALPTA